MKQNTGKKVTTQSFNNEVDKSLGSGAHKRLKLGCKKGNLVDIYINLPQEIAKEDTLKTLLNKAAEKPGSNCGKKFFIDPIGY